MSNQPVKQNPYQPPAEGGDGPTQPKRKSRRNKFWYGYVGALVSGVVLGGIVLAGPLADLDDSGGLQLLIGGFLGVVIYHLLF